MSDFRKKAAGRPRSAPSRTVSGLKAETKEANVVKELCPLKSGRIQIRKPCVAPSVP